MPFHPISTMNPSIYWFSAFLAQTIKISRFPFPIHLFSPFIKYPPSTFLTLVYKPEASEPKFFSVKAHPPISSRLLILSKYFFFWSSDPSFSIVKASSEHL
jgi:hypothetical protein